MEGHTDLVASAAYRPEPASVAAARKFVRETLQTWLGPAPAGDDPALVDDAVLLTSELVTNAVVHARTPVQVTCKLAASVVEVVVRDNHPARMVPGPDEHETVPAERTSGRGLLLPSALATAWGVSYGPAAKAVWFRLGVSGEATTIDPAGADPDTAEVALPLVPWNVRRASPEEAPADGAMTGGGTGPQPRAELGLAAGPDGWSAADLSGLGYDELLIRAAEAARAALAADAAYALVADQDGDLSVRAAAGMSPSGLLRSAPSVSTAAFIADGRVSGLLVAAAILPGRFGDADIQRLQQLADVMSPALERARLRDLEQARRARIEVLSEAGRLLSWPASADEIVTMAVQVAVPRLAQWCAVALVAPDGSLRPAAVRHDDPARGVALTWLIERAVAMAPEGVVHAGPRPGSARSWPLDTLPVDGAPEGSAGLAFTGAWCFPLVARGETIGLLMLGGPAGGRPSREVCGLAEDLAGRTALSLDNARLSSPVPGGPVPGGPVPGGPVPGGPVPGGPVPSGPAARSSRAAEDMPSVPGMELAVVQDDSGASLQAAGDFCDVFPVGGARWRFAIGEVCGTGPATAALTSLARHAVRILAREQLSIPAVLGRLNELVLAEAPAGMFLTLVHGEISPGPPAQITLACAGQPLPLVLRAPGDWMRGESGTPAAEVAATPQPLLGVIEGLAFTAQDVTLGGGDLLLCVTDGVTRRRDGDRLLDDDDGLARLLSGCAGLTAEVVAAKVGEEVRGFGAGRPPADGMAVLAFRATS
ncbi:MAG TPA: SpoIIE family protein phosphatase [Streptosporangiaceae bacterium]|nr:SpoIIE family protein phosphatase [Streptosporangiaceae bacterium]